ncbi:hypothetical protein BK120_21790 [Paenibacillus sp. FSL A5-0031]|uniref:hypothetical protein n=1 Tax=Paenibacillus sp. FSL A5-0031 TaxID=1920420 RepID=UPI00096E31A7|nr:hypothetical protein [Paenibacillus sp. FSL A5-0031]OME79611.1 hypothetical protein BK120_21790 [Paenibacillus sp. FSL A5-0031]
MIFKLDLSMEVILKAAIMLFYVACAFGLIAAIRSQLFRSWNVPFFLDTTTAKKMEEEDKTFSHLELLLRSTSKTFHRNSVNQFISLCIGVMVIVYAILLVGFSAGEPLTWWNRRAFGFAGIIALLPYGLLRIKLYNLRRENSYALIEATELLILKYRSPGTQGDLYHALYDTADELQGTMKRAFSSLVTILQLQGKSAIREGVELFKYQIDNSWAKQLGVLFTKAAKENRNIGRALEKVHTDMQESKRIVEAEKSEYMDSIIMGYFPLILVPASIYGINRMFEGAIMKILFDDPKTLQALILCIIFIVIGLVTSLILSKPKIEV